MGCSGSKNVSNGSSTYRPNYSQQQQYTVNIPPSTLPPGWISQYDPSKQSLYYVYPQTNTVTWAHPLGPSYHAQETARFHQIQQLQMRQFGNNQSGFYDSYNRQGGMSAGALAMGMVAGGAMGLVAGSMLAGGLHDGYGYGGDVIPAETVSGGGDFGGGDFGGGDFGGGF